MPAALKGKLAVRVQCTYWSALDQVSNLRLMYQPGCCSQVLKETDKTDVCKVTLSRAMAYGKCWSKLYQAMLEVTADMWQYCISSIFVCILSCFSLAVQSTA